MSYKDKVEKCPKCGKEFIVRYLAYPSNLDDKRTSNIDCPYCNYLLESVRLAGNEDISIFKKEDIK